MSHVTIHDITVEDVPALVAIGERFFRESNFSHLTFAPDKLEHILNVFLEGDCGAWLARIDGRLVGVLLQAYAQHFTVEPIAQLFQMFVAPEARSQGVGRALWERAVEGAKERGCALFYAASTGGFMDSGINNARMEKLLTDIGFVRNGEFFRAELWPKQ